MIALRRDRRVWWQHHENDAGIERALEKKASAIKQRQRDPPLQTMLQPSVQHFKQAWMIAFSECGVATCRGNAERIFEYVDRRFALAECQRARRSLQDCINAAASATLNFVPLRQNPTKIHDLFFKWPLIASIPQK